MPTENSEQVPVNVAGSSTFGVWPKISLEKTYNMYMSDEWMIGFPGYKKVALSGLPGEGRSIFRSVRGNFLLAVTGSAVYKIGPNLIPVFISTLATSTGEVFIDENTSSQICLVDGLKAYIYNYAGNTFTPQNLQDLDGPPNPIIPNYVAFHNGFFLIASAPTSINNFQWYAFVRNNDTSIVLPSNSNIMSISTKPDMAIAVRRVPGRSNSVIIFGSSVCEIFASLEGPVPYLRVSSYNIDNGCVSISTIAASEETIAWLAVNESNSPVIMVSNGSETRQISSDGIDHLMESIKFPEESTAFFFRQNGHLFYQLTFFNPQDNLTLAYDFNTQKFFHLSDENLNFHIARDMVYFNEQSFLISLKDAALYEVGDQFNTYSYSEDSSDVGLMIPRIRICKAIRKKDSATFRCGMFTFWIEQGINNYFQDSICDGELITEITEQPIISENGFIMLAEFGSCNYSINRPRVDMSISKNGNETFGNFVSRDLQPMSHFKNQIRWHRIGQANELTVQLRFWNFNRVVCTDGIAEIY